MSGGPLLLSLPLVASTDAAFVGYVDLTNSHYALRHLVAEDRKDIEVLPTQFHADNLSSAHIYLRLMPQQTWDTIPQALLDDCAQLTKANSIEGAPPSPSDIISIKTAKYCRQATRKIT